MEREGDAEEEDGAEGGEADHAFVPSEFHRKARGDWYFCVTCSKRVLLHRVFKFANDKYKNDLGNAVKERAMEAAKANLIEVGDAEEKTSLKRSDYNRNEVQIKQDEKGGKAWGKCKLCGETKDELTFDTRPVEVVTLDGAGGSQGAGGSGNVSSSASGSASGIASEASNAATSSITALNKISANVAKDLTILNKKINNQNGKLECTLVFSSADNTYVVWCLTCLPIRPLPLACPLSFLAHVATLVCPPSPLFQTMLYELTSPFFSRSFKDGANYGEARRGSGRWFSASSVCSGTVRLGNGQWGRRKREYR